MSNTQREILHIKTRPPKLICVCLLSVPFAVMSANESADTLNVSHTQSNPEKAEPLKEVHEASVPTLVEDEDDFPHGVKLALLTLALCLSVFLVALVRSPSHFRRFSSLTKWRVV